MREIKPGVADGLLRYESCGERNPHQFGQAAGLHLGHDVGAMHLDGPGADVEIVGDRLVGVARHHPRQHLALALAEFRSSSRAARSIAAIRVSSSNGFSMKSRAPAFIASTAIGTSPWPVITMDGILAASSFSFRIRSTPLMSGMRRSVTRHPLRIVGAAARKAVAESCSRTAKPETVSMKASDLRTGSSSSTMWTM